MIPIPPDLAVAALVTGLRLVAPSVDVDAAVAAAVVEPAVAAVADVEPAPLVEPAPPEPVVEPAPDLVPLCQHPTAGQGTAESCDAASGWTQIALVERYEPEPFEPPAEPGVACVLVDAAGNTGRIGVTLSGCLAAGGTPDGETSGG
jgi:hypothetical protein